MSYGGMLLYRCTLVDRAWLCLTQPIYIGFSFFQHFLASLFCFSFSRFFFLCYNATFVHYKYDLC